MHDTGAYTPYGMVVPIITAMPAARARTAFRNYAVEFDGGLHEQGAVSAVPRRRPAARRFVMERMIDRIARELGLEPDEVRRRNFIQPDEFPWDVGLTFQDGAPTATTAATTRPALELALSDDRLSRLPRAAGRRRAPRAATSASASACYVEGTGIGPYEGAHVRIEPSGQRLRAPRA